MQNIKALPAVPEYPACWSMPTPERLRARPGDVMRIGDALKMALELADAAIDAAAKAGAPDGRVARLRDLRRRLAASV